MVYIYADDKVCHLCGAHAMNSCDCCGKGVCTFHARQITIGAGKNLIICKECHKVVRKHRMAGHVNVDSGHVKEFGDMIWVLS